MHPSLKVFIKHSLFGDEAALQRAPTPDYHTPQHPRWSRSNAPYFKEKYALKVKETIDAILADKSKTIIWKVEGRPNSLYLRFNQGKEYLLEMMDPDCKYLSAIPNITVKRSFTNEPIGLLIYWNQANTPESVRIEEVKDEPKADKPTKTNWRNKLEKFVEEGGDKAKIVLRDVEDNPTSRDIVSGIIGNLENFYYMFLTKAKQLIVVRCDDPEQMSELKKML